MLDLWRHIQQHLGDWQVQASAFVQANPDTWVYLSIPLTAAVVGWFTNVLALRMTFYPVEFKGVDLGPLLRPIGPGFRAIVGWQGIIPSKAGKMAAESVDLMLNKLIDVREQFARLQPSRIADEMTPTIDRLAREVVEEAMRSQVPLLWNTLPLRRKEAIIQQAIEEFPHAVEEMMEDVRGNILELWDVKTMVVQEITKHKDILNEIFLRCGKAEFRFIELSGIYFGFLFGLLQMALWYVIEDWPGAWLSLPLGGLIIGYLTNVIALKLIFEPEQPIRLGIVTFQGLFIKRQAQVAVEYARVVSTKLFTMEKIFRHIIYGPASDKIVRLLEKHVNEAVDKTAGLSRSLIQIAAGTRTYQGIKDVAVQRFMSELPRSITEVFDYAEEALRIEETFREKMAGLPPDEFVNFLRPVFKEDEWKLILVGALLGMAAGFVQLAFFLLG